MFPFSKVKGVTDIQDYFLIITIEIYSGTLKIKCLIQVLHGCLQSVLWKVRLNPLTDAIPVVNFYLTIDEIYKISFGAKTSPYGPHGLGYRRATKTLTKWS